VQCEEEQSAIGKEENCDLKTAAVAVLEESR
jgi:hypothetical protein